MTSSNSRMQTWRKARAQRGIKRMDVFVSEETHQALGSIKQDTRQSYGEIIDGLLASKGTALPAPPAPTEGMRPLVIQLPEREFERLSEEYMDKGGLDKHVVRKVRKEAQELIELDDPNHPANF